MNRVARCFGGLLALLALVTFTRAYASSHAPPAGIAAVTVTPVSSVAFNAVFPDAYVAPAAALTGLHYLDSEPSTGAVPCDGVEPSGRWCGVDSCSAVCDARPPNRDLTTSS